MNQEKLYARALGIVAKAFKDKLDKGGQPYFLHCLRVAEEQTSTTRKIIGILHDLVEDTEWTFEELLEKGFGLSVIVPLKLLTHDNVAQTYEEYIEAISKNEDARAVKMADLKDNSQITRLKGLTKADFARVDKYHKAYVYLSKV
jgi:(p)ppGpp synthase/HD superfamily hydrolase